MTIIASLKVTNADRPRQLPVIVQRRNKLINALHDQLELARAEAEGREYLKTRRRHMKNPVTGEYAEAVVSRRPRGWFWTANDGKVYISLRYGTRVIEIAKGKSAIEVGEKRQLVPVIEALKQAVAAGELDNHLNGAGAAVSQRFMKVERQ
jgi:hypothetical protein